VDLATNVIRYGGEGKKNQQTWLTVPHTTSSTRMWVWRWGRCKGIRKGKQMQKSC